jgi:hypothetical protein
VVQDERARLLDLESGQFFALDPVGTQMLRGALAGEPAEAMALLAAEYEVAPERVEADRGRLLEQMQRRGLLAAARPRRSCPRLPGRLALFCWLAWAWICLRLFGWAGTVRLWRRSAGPAPAALAIAEAGDVVETVSRAVQAAAAGHVLNAQCKERALVCWHLLHRRWGLPAQLVLGVMLYPFEAHAWVECGPWTATDERTNCEAYLPVARYR